MEINYVGIVISFLLMMAVVCGLYLGLKKLLPSSPKEESAESQDSDKDDEEKEHGEHPKED